MNSRKESRRGGSGQCVRGGNCRKWQKCNLSYATRFFVEVRLISCPYFTFWTTSSSNTMDDTTDPLHQFFTASEAEDQNILYNTLSISNTATPEEIRKAYRRLALLHHPDKHSSKSDEAKADAATQFQKIGFAYAVLSDEKRRKTYDKTGKTAENAFADAEEMGWEKYFESLFTRIDRKALDDDKKKYQGELFPMFTSGVGWLMHRLVG